MVVGRLNRESYPVKGTMPGFTPQHKLPDGSFIDTGETNPLPTNDDLVLAKLAEMDTKIGTTNIRLNGVLDTNLVGAVGVNNFPTDQKVSDSDVLAKLTELDSKMNGIIDGSTPANTQLVGGKVEEQLTEADSVTGTLTFSNNIQYIGIYNTDSTNTGIFNVNGFDIHVPASESFEANIGGTPSTAVNVSGSTSYIVTRYV